MCVINLNVSASSLFSVVGVFINPQLIRIELSSHGATPMSDSCFA